MTAAIVAPICGTRSSSPTISASTIGEGAPTITAATPTTVPAMTEITMLPISVKDTALQTSPSMPLEAARVLRSHRARPPRA